MKANDFLLEQVDIMASRASERDCSEGERSMAATVTAFNAIFGKDLTETQGWQFMTLLKMARGAKGAFRADDYSDQVGYSALAGESAFPVNAPQNFTKPD